MRPLRPALLLAAFLAFAGTAAATEPPVTAETLPRAWCGTFSWERYNDLQHVTIALERVETRADGTLEATGRGEVKSWRAVAITVRVTVDPVTRRAELFEAPIKPTSGYIYDGSHLGTLAADFQSMRLDWTTRGTGERGSMQLQARPAGADPAQPCGLPSS